MVDGAALLLFSLLLVVLVWLLFSYLALLLLVMCLVGAAVVLMEGPRWCCCLGTPALRGGMTGHGEKREMFRLSVVCFECEERGKSKDESTLPFTFSEQRISTHTPKKQRSGCVLIT